MKRILILLIFCFVYLSSFGQIIPIDKQEHFAAGAIVGLIASKYTNKPILFSFTTSLLIGSAKEVYDSYTHRGVVDGNDVLYTVAGGVTVGVTYYLGRKIRKKKY